MRNHSINEFWKELKRRKVVRVAVVYAIVAWIAAEVSSVVFPALLLPDWTSRLVVALALIGFPVAVGLAWAFQVTPEGIRPEEVPDAPAATLVAENSREDRLDGWKRIAAHLNRDVRTVRRWEKRQGLPIRRLMHQKQATVYAYRGELDAWIEQRDSAATTSTSKQESRLRGNPVLRRSALAAMVLALVAVLAWLWPRLENSTIALGEWDWVLITDFDNRTGEDVLDGTVEYALQRELANSRFVKVAPRERINDVLQLMKLPPDTPIDIPVGREIGLRDGGIRVLISGRVEKLGDTYLISAQLVNPADGVTLASFSATATGQDRILPGVGELAIEVRSALGEGLTSIQASEAMLAKVTTPSLGALRLFSQADAIFAGDERRRALPLLEEAVRLDPDFASAHLLLWYAYMDRDQIRRAEHHLQRAVELAEQTSERERLFILASYYGFLQDDAKAIETYELLLQLYPDHFWAAGNLASIHEVAGRFDLALPLRKRIAELRPHLGYIHWKVAALAVVTGEDETIRQHRKTGLNLAEAEPRNVWLLTNLLMLPVHQDWVNGRYEEALKKTETIIAEHEPAALVEQGWLFAHVRSIYLALGRLERFREISGWRPQLGWVEALLDLESGNPTTVEAYLENQSAGYWTATLFALAGHAQRAQMAIEDPRSNELVPPPFFMRAWKNLARGQLALTEGRPAEVVRLLDKDLQVKFNNSQKYALMFAIRTLAQAHEALGDPQQAIETLEQSRLQKPLTIFDPAATWMWQRNQLYLHELYLSAGRSSAAEDVAAELGEVLRMADPNHPFRAAIENPD